MIYLLLQVAFLVFWFLLSREYIANFYLILEFLSLCVVLYIVREDGNSSYKIPWIILNLALPIVGGLSYIMFARVRFSREERRLLKDVNFRYARAVFEKPDAMEPCVKKVRRWCVRRNTCAIGRGRRCIRTPRCAISPAAKNCFRN